MPFPHRMIHQALKTVADDLNAMLQRQRGDSHSPVVLCPVAGPANGRAVEAEDKVCLMLTQITEESSLRNIAPPARTPGTVLSAPPLRLTLHVLFAAQYARYEAGLQMIADVIACLQVKPLFTPANTPAMAPGLDQLSLDMYPQSYADQCDLWRMLGTSYQPSVLYSLRMVTTASGPVAGTETVPVKPAPRKRGGSAR